MTHISLVALSAPSYMRYSSLLLERFSMFLTCVPSEALVGVRPITPYNGRIAVLKAVGPTIAPAITNSKRRTRTRAARMLSNSAHGGSPTKKTKLSLFYNDIYRVELPQGHRFPMEKYRLVREVQYSSFLAILER